MPLEERNPEELTREELQELVRRQRANTGVKPENGRGVKRERSNTIPATPVRPLKTSKVAGKTVYHIDSDDDEDDEGGKEEENGGVDGSGTESDVEVVDLA